MSTWVKRARRFFALPRCDRVDLFRMLMQMMFFRILLMHFGFKAACAVAKRERREPGPIPDAHEIQRLARLTRFAARSGLVGSPCLAASLALSSTLRNRGLGTTLHLGIQRCGGKLDAHAWLESQGNLVFDTGDGATFATIAAFDQQK